MDPAENEETHWDSSFFEPLFAAGGDASENLKTFLGGWIYSDDQGALAFRMTPEFLERLDERSEPERFAYEIVRSAPGMLHIRMLSGNDEIDEEQIMECRDGILRCFDEDGTRLEAFERVRNHGPYQPKELQIAESPVFESMPEQVERMKRIHEQHEERMRQYVDSLLGEGG